MPLVKICGVTDPAIATFSAACGADYIGIVLYSRSPRVVSLKQAKEIAAATKAGGALPIGIFVGASAAEIIASASEAGIGHIQAYGLAEALPSEFCRFYPDGCGGVFRQGSDFLLVDGPEPGSGKRGDWDLLTPPDAPWFLAGGIHCGNVDEAMLRFSPQGIDVSSGVETDGNKDLGKIEELIKRVKAYE